MDSELIKKVLDSELAREGYRDLAAPATKEVGTLIKDCVSVAKWLAAPIEFAAAYRQRWLGFLKRISEKVPEDRQVAPEPSIALPVLNELRFQEEGSPTAEMYVELMARAIDKERQHEAHPAFVEVIRQLTRDEVYILTVLSQYQGDGLRTLSCWDGEEIVETATLQDPIVIKSHDDDSVGPIPGLHNPRNIHAYRDHLNSLGLIVLSVGGGHACLNDFGRAFVAACGADKPVEAPEA